MTALHQTSHLLNLLLAAVRTCTCQLAVEKLRPSLATKHKMKRRREFNKRSFSELFQNKITSRVSGFSSSNNHPHSHQQPSINHKPLSHFPYRTTSPSPTQNGSTRGNRTKIRRCASMEPLCYSTSSNAKRNHLSQIPHFWHIHGSACHCNMFRLDSAILRTLQLRIPRTVQRLHSRALALAISAPSIQNSSHLLEYLACFILERPSHSSGIPSL